MMVYLLIGGNLGDRASYLTQAEEQIAQKIGTIIALSRIYETVAWGYTDQPHFLNRALAVETALPITEILPIIHAIEHHLGRERHQKWYARTIDIDILLMGEGCWQSPDLVIPHPYLAQRRFVLAPLAEIAPNLSHPIVKLPISTLLAQCPDPLEVWLWEQPSTKKN